MFKKLLKKPSLKANVIANFLGNGWSALITILFVPLYLKYIGPEGYGLIGLFASLQVVLSLLDTGLSTTLNKEIANLSVLPNTQQQICNLVKTLGNIYWLIALIAGIIALCLSPILAQYWVHAKELSVHTITYALVLLSVSIVFQFPSSFYGGGLVGLQRQVVLNILRIIFASIKSVGGLLVLLLISRSVLAFFSWTLFVSVMQAFTYKYILWYCMPQITGKPKFDKRELTKVWKFTAGMTAISLTALLLTQVDKIILSKILSLEHFGYYTFAFTAGSITYMLVSPVAQSYFPKFCALLTENKLDEIITKYHQACQLVSLLVLPFALFLSLFSREILFIWTNNKLIVENTWQITSIVAIAVGIHSLMVMPYMLCLAYNNTKLAFYTNIFILIIFIPSIIFLATKYGGLGGAVCWLIITLLYFFINPVMIHRHFLKGETLYWYWNDTIKPIIGSILILILSKYTLSIYQFNHVATTFFLVIVGIASFIAALFSSKELCQVIFKTIRSMYKIKESKIYAR